MRKLAPFFTGGGIKGGPACKRRGRERIDIMEKYKKLIAIFISIAIIVTFVPKKPVYADALTAGMLGSIAYGIATATGVNLAFASGTASGATEWMTGEMREYASSQGMSVVEFFGTDAALMGSTALLVGKYTYDKIGEFITNLVQKYDLSTTLKEVYGGTYNGQALPLQMSEESQISSTGISVIPSRPRSQDGDFRGYDEADIYVDGVIFRSIILASTKYCFAPGYKIEATEGGVTVKLIKIRIADGLFYTTVSYTVPDQTYTPKNVITAGLTGDYREPQPLPQGKQWEGDFAGTPGFAEPPTDLPDFLSRIPVAVAENQLEVVQEIVEAGGTPPPSPTPSPTPSPRPTPEPVPQITIAQKIAAILGEIMGLIGLTGDTPLTEEQQQQIADTAQNIEDSVKDITQNITDAITQQRTETSYDIQDQTQTITQGQQQIKDAIQDQTQTITDTLPDIKDAIQDQTQDITDIKDAIEDATQVPTDFEPQKHPLLRGVFPFCIPFDLHDIIVALDAEPVTPEVHIPFRVPTIMGMNFGLDYTFDLDLHDFDGLAQVLRTLEFIAFGVGLLFVTGKVIKW